jgi:hypothetical protein
MRVSESEHLGDRILEEMFIVVSIIRFCPTAGLYYRIIPVVR